LLPENVWLFATVGYGLAVAPNKIGRSWLTTLCVMEGAKFVEVRSKEGAMVSVSPWHVRDVGKISAM
jgi:hypothetical protein